MYVYVHVYVCVTQCRSHGKQERKKKASKKNMTSQSEILSNYRKVDIYVVGSIKRFLHIKLHVQQFRNSWTARTAQNLNQENRRPNRTAINSSIIIIIIIIIIMMIIMIIMIKIIVVIIIMMFIFILSVMIWTHSERANGQ